VWNDADITELLSFRTKSILAGDLNAKNPVWNNRASKPSGLKLLDLFIYSNFDISAPQCPTHFVPDGRGDVLDIAVHQDVRLSEVIVLDILDSDHLPIMFSILDHVKAREVSDPVEKFRLGAVSKFSL
jgi:endonuclease/exonuclease/phosphatase (EEP) superfamily protein YafD